MKRIGIIYQENIQDILVYLSQYKCIPYVLMEYDPRTDLDGILLNKYDERSKRFIYEMLEKHILNIPIFSFGEISHILYRYLGGQISYTVKEHENSKHGMIYELSRGLYGFCNVNSNHTTRIDTERIPVGYEICGWSCNKSYKQIKNAIPQHTDLPEAFVNKEQKILGVTWNPIDIYHTMDSYIFREFQIQIGDPLTDYFIRTWLRHVEGPIQKEGGDSSFFEVAPVDR